MPLFSTNLRPHHHHHTVATPIVPTFSFSSVHCTGWDFTDTSFERSICHFRNVCIKENTWHYIVQNKSDLPPGVPPVVSTQPISYGEFIPAEKIFFNVTEDTSLFKSIGYNSIPTAAVFEQYNSIGFGHVFGDEVMAIYHGLKLFDLENEDFLPIDHIAKRPLWDTCLNHPKNEKFQKLCKKFRTSLYPLISNHLPIPMNNITGCFQHVVIGTGYLTDHCRDETMHGKNNVFSPCNYGLGPIFKDFHYYIRKRMQSQVVYNDKEQRRILAIFESHKGLIHMSEVANIAQKTAQMYHLGYEEYHNFTDYDILSQMKIVSRAQVVLLSPGSISFLAFFLRPGSTMILLYTQYKYDAHLWPHVTHLKIHFICADCMNEYGKVLKYTLATL